MFCLPQDLNQLVLGELMLGWSSVLWGDTDQYTNVGNKGSADSWLSLPPGSCRSGRGFRPDSFCRTTAQGAAGRGLCWECC